MQGVLFVCGLTAVIMLAAEAVKRYAKRERKRNGKNMRNICRPAGRYRGKGCRRERRKRMPKNSINLIQIENTKEGIEKLADLLLIATENMTYMQYKLHRRCLKTLPT